jgi:penicillin-binding protein 1A
LAKRKKKRSGGSSWLPRVLLILAATGSLALLVAAIVVRVVEAGLPEVPTFDAYRDGTPKVSRVLAADGSVVAEFFVQRRTLTEPEKIPETLERAVLAAEDAKFHAHAGLSYMGIMRAMLVNFWRGRVSQGGSTITQQVVKQVLLSSERTYERKFRELLLARLLERKLSKREILAIYMSHIYLGHGRYGFEEAARFYFGRPASSLDLAQSALLAGLVSAPEANSPLRNPDRAMARQRYVLNRLEETGLADPDAVAQARSQRLRLHVREAPRLGAAPYFVDAVRREVLRLLGPGALLNDGLTISTTLDLRASDAAEAAVALGLADLYARGRTRVRDEAAAAQRAGAADADAEGEDGRVEDLPPPPKSVRARVVRCDPSGRIEVEAAGRRATLDPRSLMRAILADGMDPYALCREDEDGIPVSLAGRLDEEDDAPDRLVNAELGPQAAVAVLDPRTRAVRALVGGEEFGSRPFNRAVQSRRPMGSTVKPFLYAAALDGGIDASETFPNQRICFRGARGRPWCPRNYSGGYDGKDYDMGEALAKSTNVVAVRVMQRIGAGPVADLLASLGIDGAPRDLSLALGSAETTPLALANAMATLAADGRYDTPYLIEDVVDARGRVLLRHEARPSRPIEPRTARTLRRWLRQAVTDGSARAAADLPVPAWGKTGTSNRAREAWFAGSDGDLVTAFVVGYDDRLPMRGATGGNTAVPLFKAFVRMRR